MRGCSFLIFVHVLQFLCISGILFDDSSSSNTVSVHTNVGEVLGKVKSINFDGKQYQVKAFLGIPYAEPPVGNNRFRKPVPKSPLTSPFAAFNYGASCLQAPLYGLSLSEDCLFLNVFVPVNANVSLSPFPVMVWIHGGGFRSGTSTIYPADTLSSYGEVIVVTLNYRLAHLGFLWTDEGIGNFGLWDQHLAIKWVSDNIALFGGDVSRITIFGESAGSTSVVYQALYPGNKHLFQRAIAQSGGITSPWGLASNDNVKATFANFSGEIGCQGSHREIMTCLRNKSSDEVAKVQKSATLNYTKVVPNKDNDFAPQHPRFMLSTKTGTNRSLDFFYSLDFMMGSNSIDGALYLNGFANAVNITDPENLKIPRDLYEDYFIQTTIASIFSDLRYIPDLMKDATVFEYTNWTNPDDYMARNFMLVKLRTDAAFFVPSVATVGLHSEGLRGRSYLYELSVRPTTRLIPVPSWLDGPTQAQHGDDLAYVFGFSEEIVKWFSYDGVPFEHTPQDITISKAIMAMWSNFAKTGNPNEPASIQQHLPTTWSEYNATSQSYLDITPVMTPKSVKQGLRAKQVKFWLEILPSLLNYSSDRS